MAAEAWTFPFFDFPVQASELNAGDYYGAVSEQASPSIAAPCSPAEWSPLLYPGFCGGAQFGGSDNGCDPPAVADYDPPYPEQLHNIYTHHQPTYSTFPLNYTLVSQPLQAVDHVTIGYLPSGYPPFAESPPDQLYNLSSPLEQSHTVSDFSSNVDIGLQPSPLLDSAAQTVQTHPASSTGQANSRAPYPAIEHGRRRRAELRELQKPPHGGYLHSCPEPGCEQLKPMKPSALKVHSYVHTGERPHACDICGDTFTKVFNRNRHRRSCVASKAADRKRRRPPPTDSAHSITFFHDTNTT